MPKTIPVSRLKCKSCGRRVPWGELRVVNTLAGPRRWCSICRQDSLPLEHRAGRVRYPLVRYPENWPRCVCGDYALDGKATCGRVECGAPHGF